MKKTFMKQLGGFLKTAKKGLQSMGGSPRRKPRRSRRQRK